ncbi:MAG: ATP synthase F1 subunit epsilon [Clostridiales bacterium]|nr:ATP synthase F1 subunit epsilon [Clostridiales bacterium]
MKSFRLEIITPQEPFFDDAATAVTVRLENDDEITVLADHAPMAASLGLGEIKVKNTDGEWHEFYASEGFMQVRPDEVIVFVQYCVWAEDVDELRAKEDVRKAFENMRFEQSLREHKENELLLKKLLMEFTRKSKT